MHTANLQKAITMKPPVANVTVMTLAICNDGSQSKKSSFEQNLTINHLLAIVASTRQINISVLTLVIKNSVHFLSLIACCGIPPSKVSCNILLIIANSMLSLTKLNNQPLIFCFPFLKAWLTWGTQQHSRTLAC